MRNERGFLTLAAALPVLGLLLLALGFVFVTEMRAVLALRADGELRQEVNGSLRAMLEDAAEAEAVRILASGSSGGIELHKAAADHAGRCVVAYRVRILDGCPRLTQGVRSPQPMTGRSELGEVEVTALDAAMTASGCLHLRLAARSRRTGHRYEQAAAVPLARLP